MSRPVLLDLFCGAGGAAVGYYRAGFDVVGVDSCPQPNYPFTFRQADAIEYLAQVGDEYDAIHASPPCQAHTGASFGYRWPDLIPATRELLDDVWDTPYVIENVPAALLPNATRLCGTQFEGLRVIRHRDFSPGNWGEVELPALGHGTHPPVYGSRNRDVDQDTGFVQVTGGGNCRIANARSAMGIDWMGTKGELNEAIPPAYTEYVGKYLMRAVRARAVAA